MSYILSHQDEFVKPTDIKIALTLLGEGASCPIAFTGLILRDHTILTSQQLQVSFSPKAIHTRSRFVGFRANNPESSSHPIVLFFFSLRSGVSW